VAFSGLTVPLLKFDPGLGTLTQVTLQLGASTDSGSMAWDNEAGVSSDVTLGIGADLTATAPLSLIVLGATPRQVGSGTVDADNDDFADFIGTDAFAVTGGSGSDSDVGFTTSSLSTFVSTFAGETFDTTLDSSVDTFLSTTGGFGPIDPVPGVTYGTVTVTYEYVVPEPGTLILMVMGILLTCASPLMKRRSSQR
jgi:hypothetical protein